MRAIELFFAASVMTHSLLIPVAGHAYPIGATMRYARDLCSPTELLRRVAKTWLLRPSDRHAAARHEAWEGLLCGQTPCRMPTANVGPSDGPASDFRSACVGYAWRTACRVPCESVDESIVCVGSDSALLPEMSVIP